VGDLVGNIGGGDSTPDVASAAAVEHVSQGPARGYSWAPFEPGHEITMKHGAWSPRRVDPLATEILAEVEPTVTWWTPADRPAVWAWAQAEARLQLVVEYLANLAQDDNAGGMVDAEGEVRSAANLLVKLEKTASYHRSRLGLDPLSRARLKRDTAAAEVDVAQLLAKLAAAAPGVPEQPMADNDDDEDDEDEDDEDEDEDDEETDPCP
jgi:hypothetical protein